MRLRMGNRHRLEFFHDGRITVILGQDADGVTVGLDSHLAPVQRRHIAHGIVDIAIVWILKIFVKLGRGQLILKRARSTVSRANGTMGKHNISNDGARVELDRTVVASPAIILLKVVLAGQGAVGSLE
ncbi:hypothetical protein PoMZ_07822 [Pyricularia oryzae]|uniref:Uncharacterized protein n=1 Tax=Pyricularia oryzae TaxID=318829 RepID=A0A4V1C6S2_PYROR|nr:hypothetical protein PoMZ_07822 [Pyricularia oryzae]